MGSPGMSVEACGGRGNGRGGMGAPGTALGGGNGVAGVGEMAGPGATT
jgi:hypothetical protein